MSATQITGRRRILLPAVMTAAMLVVLVSLGVWQVQRLAWKRGLLAAIAQAETAPPVALPPAPTQFQKVAVEGRFRPQDSALYGAQVEDTPLGPTMGAQLLVPLDRADAPTILVDRGWVPQGAPVQTPTGAVTVSGYVRTAEHPGWFSAHDDPPGRHFYTLDPPAIGRALGLRTVAPFTLVVLGNDDRGEWPIPARHLPRPPNDHLSYAITWFGLACVLAVVFVTYIVKARKQVLLF